MPGFLLRAAQHGPLVGFHLGRRPVVLVNEPAEVHRILVTEAGSFHKSRGLQRTRRVLGDGLLTSEGAFHLRQRRLAQKAFMKGRIDAYGPMMERCVAEMSATWGGRRDVLLDLNRLTLRIAALTLFSADLTGSSAQVGEALDTFVHAFPRLLVPGSELMEKLPFYSPVRQVARARRQLDEVIFGMIRGRRASGELGTDLLGLLMAAVDEDGSQMDDKQLRDELVTMLLAGHETTALALSWTLYLLSQHPSWQERPEDAREIFGEALRLYPPAWVMGRECQVPYQLGPYRLPKGTTFFISPLVLQRDARFYPNPLAFDPLRERTVFYPFGGGVRQCIGERFAWLEGTLVLSALLKEWRFSYPGNTPPGMQGSVTLRPRGGMVLDVQRCQTVANCSHSLASVVQ